MRDLSNEDKRMLGLAETQLAAQLLQQGAVPLADSKETSTEPILEVKAYKDAILLVSSQPIEQLRMTVEVARAVALALRRAANVVEKELRERGVK